MILITSCNKLVFMRFKPTIITIAVNIKIMGKRHMNHENGKTWDTKTYIVHPQRNFSRLFSPHFFRLGEGAHGCPSPKSNWKQIAGVFSTLDYPHSFGRGMFFNIETEAMVPIRTPRFPACWCDSKAIDSSDDSVTWTLETRRGNWGIWLRSWWIWGAAVRVPRRTNAGWTEFHGFSDFRKKSARVLLRREF